MLEVGDDHLRDHDRSHAGIGLRRSEHESAVGQLLVLLLDPHRAVEQVEVAVPQCSDLAESQAAERCQQNRRSELRGDRIGDVETSSSSRPGALRGAPRRLPSPHTDCASRCRPQQQ